MITPSGIQIYYFICAITSGIIVGLMIDSYRSIRYWYRPRGMVTALSDMLFWILCAIIIFIFFLYTNNGDFRYYTIIGMGLGMLLYYKLLSGILLMGMKWFIYYMGKAIRLIWSILIFPVKGILYIVGFVRSITGTFLKRQRIKLDSKRQAADSKKLNKKAGKSKAIQNNNISISSKSAKKKH